MVSELKELTLWLEKYSMGTSNDLRTTILVITLTKPYVFRVYKLPRASSSAEVMAASVRRGKAVGFKEKWPKVF